MKEKSVSVIIPCYNGARFLPEAIESIMAQTYSPSEIIVVDDGSTDSSGEIAASYQGVRYVRQENQGVAAARNVGLRESRGDYLVFHDQDDRLLPDALEVGVNCLNNHPQCAFAFGLFRLIGADGMPLPKPSHPGQGKRPHHRRVGKTIERNIETNTYRKYFSYLDLLSARHIVPTSTAIFRRGVLESMGGFDTSLIPMDDYDLYVRIARIFPIYCHNQVIVEYRKHTNNLSRNLATAVEPGLRVINAQRKFIKGNESYEVAYKLGREKWLGFWGFCLSYEVVRNLRAGQLVAATRCVFLLIRHCPKQFVLFPLELLKRLVQWYRHYRR
jgi:glycosyltransferase involved in cell wall biosynthesis